MGMALVFPDTQDGTPQLYWTADLPDVLLERPEMEDLEQEDDL
jgi:hypothetical protein